MASVSHNPGVDNLRQFSFPLPHFRLHLARSPLSHVPEALVVPLSAAIALSIAADAGATSVPPARTANPASPTKAPIDIETRWLSNGLRVVTIAGPWPEDDVSIRLVVRGGVLTSCRKAERYCAHFVEHLVFNRTGTDSDVYAMVESRGGETYACVTLDHGRHDFDTDAARASAVLDAVLTEWDRKSFAENDVERERRRIVHELGSEEYGPPLSNLARSISPTSRLAYSQSVEKFIVAEVANERVLRGVFDERFVGGRLTLIVASHPRTIAALGPALEAFSRVPEGRGRPEPALGNLVWLSGDLRTRDDTVAGRLIGIRFFDPGLISSHVRSLIRLGIWDFVRDALKEKDCGADRVGFEDCFTPGEEVWAFVLDAEGCNEDERPLMYRAFEESLEHLASPASHAWRQRLLERRAAEYGLIADNPSAVADAVASTMSATAQDSPAPEWSDYATPLDPKCFAEGLREIRERAVVFRAFRRESPPGPVLAESSWETSDFDPSIENLVLFDTGNDGLWSAVTFVAVLMTVSAAIAVAAAQLAAGARASAVRLRRRANHADPAGKRGDHDA